MRRTFRFSLWPQPWPPQNSLGAIWQRQPPKAPRADAEHHGFLNFLLEVVVDLVRVHDPPRGVVRRAVAAARRRPTVDTIHRVAVQYLLLLCGRRVSFSSPCLLRCRF